MANIIKVKSTSVAISNVTPTTVSNATVVRVNHAGSGPTPQAINIANTGGVYASVFINPASTMFIQKQPSDTIIANAASTDLTACSIAFSQ